MIDVDESRVITVDGPASSGKSTIGKRLAQEYSLPLVDTGLFYRAVMVAALQSGVSVDDEGALVRLAETTEIIANTDPSAGEGEWEVRINGHDAGAAL